MRTLADVCQCIIADLLQAGKVIEATAEELKCFEEEAACRPVAWIEHRLKAVGSQVAAEAAQQILCHDGKGIAYIITGHDGRLFVTWIKNDSVLIEARRSWQAELTSIPEEQFSAYLKQLLQQLHQGDFEPAVKWLQAHGAWVEPLESIY